jgi:hypothetical protein
MKNITNKSSLPYLLALLAMIIWGHNGYRILRGLLQAGEIPVNISLFDWQAQVIAAENQLDVKPFGYRAEFRDPFKDWLHTDRNPKASTPIQKVSKPPLPALPALRLTGILKDAAGVLAVIEAPDGEVHFVRNSEQISGVEIIAIDSSWVECRLGTLKYRLDLRP